MRARGAVVVLGASGTLGRRVVRLLEADPPLRVIGAARRPGALPTREARRLDLDDPASFSGALEEAGVLVHAAGPFDHDPTALVAACLTAGVHYVDLAEDATFVGRVRDAARRQSGPARAVPGCSTTPGLVALLARRFAALDVHAVEAHLLLGSGNPVSVGLLHGLLRPLGSPAPGGGRWFDALSSFAFADGRAGTFGPYPIALAEGLGLGGRVVPVRFFTGFDRRLVNRALWLAARLVPRLDEGSLRRLVAGALPVARLAGRLGGAEGRLAVRALDAGGREQGRVEVHARREGLDVPAAPAAWAVRRLLEYADAWPAGALRLDQLVAAEFALDWLRAHGYTVLERTEERS
jgi:hypothetical protein